MTRFTSYKEIKDDYQSSWQIPYDKLLNTVEWRGFRQRIIDRDSKKCQVCNSEQSEKIGLDYFRKPTEAEIAENSKEVLFDLLGDGSFMVKTKPASIVGVRTDTPTILHVHHKYYIFGNLPWEYEHDVLLTVCHDCHVQIHQKEKVLVYVDETLQETLRLTPCTRCSGTGFLEQYLHFQNGICFKCDGRKFEEFIK